VSQSLSTTTKIKLSDQQLDSLLNDGFVHLRGVLTNQKLLEEMGQQIRTLDISKIGMVGMHNSMNTNPFIRALVNDTNIRSVFEQIAKHTFANAPEVNCPMVFQLQGGRHHNLDELHYGKVSPWGDHCSFHMDAFPTDVTDNHKEPDSLVLWIALSHSKAPMAIWRESHRNWGSAWAKCANDSTTIHRNCFDLDCAKEILGASKIWAADVEPGDMFLWNKRTLHAGLEQETDRVALTIRWVSDTTLGKELIG
jgi:ectoine hydroxylase-related dioxygenase (phytanoyl-CoA dioxygenase family)